MSNIKDIEDFRSDDYWTKRMLETKVDRLSMLYGDMEDGDITDARIAFVRVYNVMHRLHEKGVSLEEIFAGGFHALWNKINDLSDDPEVEDKLRKIAHDRITEHHHSCLCYEKLGIDDVT